MGFEEVKDSIKEMDWKSIGGGADQQSDTKTVTQKRLPKKMRQIPDYYFLPRRSIPSAIAFYGSFIAAGIGAGMLLEVWIEKKVKADMPWGLIYYVVLSGLSNASSTQERMEALYGNSTNDLKMPSID